MVIGLILASGLSVVSAATASSSSGSWSCAYAADRLPRALSLRGDDTVSAEETRAGRRRASLKDTVLTRASNLALARSLGANRLVIISCLDGLKDTTFEAQSFSVDRPQSSEVVRIRTPRHELPAAIDEIARRLTGSSALSFPSTYVGPSIRALLKAGPALALEGASERAKGLIEALELDPDSIDLRISAVGALIAARDFESAIRVASLAMSPNIPPPMARALRLQAGAAQLEAGRYAEARETFESLRQEEETAAVLSNLGVACFRLRDPSALAHFDRAALIHDHRQADIAFNRALALVFESKGDSGLATIDALIESSPGDTRIRLLRVWALKRLGREAERGEEWERLMLVAPSFSSLSTPDLTRRLERVLLHERAP